MKKFNMKVEKGFTLVELMLAAAMVSLTLTGVLISFHTSSQLTESSSNRTIAISHAAYIMEDIKEEDFDNIASFINRGDWNWNASQVASEGLQALNNETTSVTVSGTTLLDVIILVNWNDASGRGQNTMLRTLISQEAS